MLMINKPNLLLFLAVAVFTFVGAVNAGAQEDDLDNLSLKQDGGKAGKPDERNADAEKNEQPDAGEPAGKPVQKAAKAADAGKLQKAADYRAKAESAFKEGKFDQALVAANVAVELDPSLREPLKLIISESNKKIGSSDVSTVVSAEDMQREENLKKNKEIADPIISGKLFEEAKALADKQKFDDAIKLIDNAKADFDKSVKGLTGPAVDILKGKVEDGVASLKSRLGQYIKDIGFEAYSACEKPDELEKKSADVYYEELKGRYDRTKEILRKAVQADNSLTPGIQKAIDHCDARIRTAEALKLSDIEHSDQENPKFNMDPERPLRLYEMEVSLKQAEVLLDNDEFILARNALEKILARDPYNLKATNLLSNIYQKLYYFAKIRKYNDTLERLTEVRWKWNEPVLPAPAVKPPEEDNVSRSSNSEMYEKLAKIVIDHMDFEDAPISSVVTWLLQKSREVDTQKEGIAIQLTIKPERLASIPRVTMNFDNIPIGELIRYICLNCGLKYRVEEHAVMIGDEIPDVMETRYFRVRAALITRIVPQEQGEKEESIASQKAGTGLFEEDILSKDDDKTAKKSLTAEALMAYFAERGIPFPEGAGIAYNRQSSRLSCTNTPENLRRLEYILRELDVESPLVLIESKFIEMVQTDLEDLSFEWIFSKDPSVQNPTDSDSWWQIAPNASTVRPLGSNMSGVLSPVDPVVNDRLINNLVFPAFGSPGRGQMHLQMMLHAIDWSDRTEILSAPKVIATSGQEAQIRMVREEYYPTSWTEPTVAITNGVFQITPPKPDLGSATDVGIVLVVTPTVSPNHYTITLQLNPQVVDLSGWTNNFYTLIIGIAGSGAQFNLKMPEISRRDATATVKVYDGETIVLGGMLTERLSAVDDRVAGIGDIPILGRLFSAKNDRSEKRNLMIFVTARLVNPDGMPVRELEGKGMPDFRR